MTHSFPTRRSSDRIAWRDGEIRPTAGAASEPKRERRRPDPLLSVTGELHDWFLAEPWRTGRELLDKLQAVHPGEHPDALLRTVQRRLKIWRAEQAHQLVFGQIGRAPCRERGCQSV